MPRKRDPRRDEAFEIWKSSDGQKKLKDIAAHLGVSDSQMRKWKSQDKWDAQTKGNVTNSKRSVTKPKKKLGGQPGNKGNPHPTPKFAKRNNKAETHGFFRTIFPDDDETLSIVNSITQKSPIDMMWENIVIQYTAIARAQKLMFVRDKDDITKVLTKEKSGQFTEEKEWEYQFAWDKQATFLQAQSRAISTLQNLIKRYEDMADTEEQQLRIEKMKIEIRDMKGEADNDAHDQNVYYEEALNGQAEDIFADEVDDDGEEI